MVSATADRRAAERRRRTSDIVDPERAQLRAHAVSGARWVTGSQLALQFTNMVTALVLARLLTPDDFGLMALVGVVSAWIDRTLGQNVTGSAVIQKPVLTPGLASSVFFLNIAVGLMAGIALAASAPAVAWLLGDERTVDLLRVIALVPVIASSSYIHRAILRRSMRFSRFAVVMYSYAVANAVASIAFGLAGFGVWALVFGSLAGTTTSTVAAWVLSGWRPLAHFRLAEIREISRFSSGLSLNNVFNYLSEYGDRYVIGRFIGTTAVGFYNVAYRLLLYPVQITVRAFLHVLFPTFSRMGDDHRAMGRGFVRAVSLVFALTLPAMTGLAILAEPVVGALLGPRWLPAATLVSILSFIAPLSVVTSATSAIYQAKGRTHAMMLMAALDGAILVTAYVIGAQWGLVGVATAYLVAEVLWVYPQLAVPFRWIGLPVRRLVAALRPFALGSAVMAAVVFPLRVLLESGDFGWWPILGICVPAGVVVYGAVILALRPPAVDDLIAVVGPRLPLARMMRQRGRDRATTSDAVP